MKRTMSNAFTHKSMIIGGFHVAKIYNNNNHMKKIITSITNIFSSLLVILGITSCCGTPILAALVSITGLGSSQISFLAEYQEYFLFMAFISLAIGFYQMYFKKKSSACCPSAGSCEIPSEDSKANTRNSLAHQIILWISTAMLIIVFYQVKNTTNVPVEKNNSKKEIPSDDIPLENRCQKKKINSCCG